MLRAKMQEAASAERCFFFVCRTCSTARGWKSPAQPGGGEGLEKRKGVVVRRGLKEAWIKGASR